MAYLVTARKWRPQTFAELVGQDHVARTLQNALRQGRIAHAYLFAGTRGVGKTTTARILAKALNCESGPTPAPCNQCTLCQSVTLGNSLDVLEIDGASNRGIDEIRDLREKIRYAPTRGRYKIYIIDEVHMLTEHAFNALLKTLEEPPPQAIFIFATTEPHKVPVTILSRCQRFDFRKVANAEIAECLAKIAEREGIQISLAALHRVARRAEGSLRDAQTLFDQVVAFCGLQIRDEEVTLLLGMVEEDQIFEALGAILARDARALLTVLSHLLQRGHDTREVCHQLLACVRDVIVAKVTPDGPGLMDRSSTEREALQHLAAQATLEELHTVFELLAVTEGKLRDSAQPIWMLEVSLIKLASLPQLQPLSMLVTRLESLERRLGQRADGTTEGSPAAATMVCESPPTPEAPSMVAASESLEAAPSPAALPVSEAQNAQTAIVQKIIESASTRTVGWILEQHCTMQVTETALQIAFHGNNRIARELLRERDTLRTLEHIAQTVVGREIAVQIIDTPEADGDERAPVRGHSRVVDDLASLTQAEIVRDTLELFGGRILDIRRRPGGQEAMGRPMDEDAMLSEEEGDNE